MLAPRLAILRECRHKMSPGSKREKHIAWRRAKGENPLHDQPQRCDRVT